MPRCDRSILLAIVFAAGATSAQPAPQPPTPAEAALVEGRRLYDLRDWDAAIAKFKESYALEALPASLFNIAQSYRLKGECAESVGFYRTYRRNYPDAPNIAKVDTFIEEMDACAKKQAEERKRNESMATLPPPPPPPAPGRTKRIAGLALAGGGVALIGTGVVFGLRARAKARDAETMGGEWDPEIEASGERADLVAKIMWGLGGVAVAGGAFLFWQGTKENQRTTVGLVPRGDGATVVFTNRF